MLFTCWYLTQSDARIGFDSILVCIWSKQNLMKTRIFLLVINSIQHNKVQGLVTVIVN